MTQASRPPWWLVALLILVAFAFQGTRGIWEPDEGRYTATALNMLDSGDYVLPTLDGGQPHLTKPPVTYWALAASFAALGRNEWAARLPGALAFVGTGLLAFGLGRRLCPAKPWLPALVYALSIAPVVGSTVVSTDVLLMLFETAAMYAFVSAWHDGGDLDRRWIRGMWVAWGLAFMTKGPPGLLPLVAVIGMLACHERRALRRLFDPVGLAAFGIVAFTWFVVLIGQDPARLQYFLGAEVYDRVFTAKHDRNAQWYGPLEVYLPMFLAGALPWWIPAMIAAGGPKKAWSEFRSRLRARDRDWLLLAWWLLLPLVIFCLARSRLQLYVLPLFVPLSLMLARPLAHWRWLDGGRLVRVAAITAVVLLALKGALAYAPSDRDSREMARAIREAIEPHDVEEIVFVGMRPFYGLDLYLGRRISGMQIGERRWVYSKVVAEEDLCVELASRPGAVYAMKQSRAEGFRASASKCNDPQPELIGEFAADDNLISLFRGHSPISAR